MADLADLRNSNRGRRVVYTSMGYVVECKGAGPVAGTEIIGI